jgi:hypothetical protein
MPTEQEQRDQALFHLKTLVTDGGTAVDAYDLAMHWIENLRQLGVRIEIKPSKSRMDAECVAKYSGPERVSTDKWVHVHFFPTTHEQKQALFEAQAALNLLGIYFDTGGFTGQRDWELDWSFRFGGVPEHQDEMTSQVPSEGN